MNTFPNISKEEIERQYFLRGLRPDYNVIGHSAGGHLTAETMLTQQKTEYGGLPERPIHSGTALSRGSTI